MKLALKNGGGENLNLKIGSGLAAYLTLLYMGRELRSGVKCIVVIIVTGSL